MLRSVRNIIVNIMAVFIRDREARHAFRNKYKRKSKFRKLRDDNIRLFLENKKLFNEIATLKAEWEADKCLTFRVMPMDDSPPKGPDSDVILAIVCVAKNEGPYLKEWIEYHKIVGVERFYIYDNESDDNTKDVLAPYIQDGTVVYHFLPNHPITKLSPQVEAYNDAIFKYRARIRWMAIIDIDEFIVPVEKNSIPEFLEDFNQYSAIGVNWVLFDSNGHESKPTAHGGLVTANYTRVRKNHDGEKAIKSIVNPKKVLNYISPHFGIYYKNYAAVTENFEYISGMHTKYHSSIKIKIDHYVTKSREEYVSKIKRNSETLTIQGGYKLNESLLNFKGDTTNDFSIQKYIPKLKIAMGIEN